MQKVFYKQNKTGVSDITNLYLTAFPENERPPVKYFFEAVNRFEDNQLISFYDKNQFVGFAYVVVYKDMVYIAFLAVSENLRGKGYGTAILNELKEMYHGYVILLCFEEVNEKYPDFDNRLRRKLFYERNGFKDNEMLTQEGTVVYQSAYIGHHQVDQNDYKILFDRTYGPGTSDIYLKFIK